MAFGYKYWMVYLPEFNRDSFLLFVHNQSGSTKLRDYSSGKARVIGQPDFRVSLLTQRKDELDSTSNHI